MCATTFKNRCHYIDVEQVQHQPIVKIIADSLGLFHFYDYSWIAQMLYIPLGMKPGIYTSVISTGCFIIPRI